MFATQTVPDWVALIVGWALVLIVVFVAACILDSAYTAVDVTAGVLMCALITPGLYMSGKEMTAFVNQNALAVGCAFGLPGLFMPILMLVIGGLFVLVPIAIGGIALKPFGIDPDETMLTAESARS